MFVKYKHTCLVYNGLFKHIECVGGWYGLDCKQQCSGHCINNDVCNHVTGQCDGGCDAGWRGALCDKGSFSFQISYSINLFCPFVSVVDWK